MSGPSDQAILEYLWFGYFLDREALERKPPTAAFTIDRARYASMREQELRTELLRAWRAAIARALDAHGRDDIVVPVSGGLDSRAVLAALLEIVEPSRISTYVHGTPGTLDYELGTLVARKAGTKHRAFDLTRYEFTPERMRAVALRSRASVEFFPHAPIDWVVEAFGERATLWSGYIGDLFAGSHLDPRPAWDEALRVWCDHHRYAPGLTPDGWRPEGALPSKPWRDGEELTFDEQLTFNLRVPSYTRNVVLFEGLRYATPFLDLELGNLMLSLPREARRGERLYAEALRQGFPALFSLPTKTSFGLPLDASAWRRQLARQSSRARTLAARLQLPLVPAHPMTNYVDFDAALRRRKDVQRALRAGLDALARRGVAPWVDVESLWRDHARRRGNHSAALRVLSTLGFNLEAREASA